MLAIYTTTLILHPNSRTKYIEVNQQKKWVKPTLEKVKKLQETYQEAAPTPAALLSLSYDKAPEDLEELNTFD